MLTGGNLDLILRSSSYLSLNAWSWCKESSGFLGRSLNYWTPQRKVEIKVNLYFSILCKIHFSNIFCQYVSLSVNWQCGESIFSFPQFQFSKLKKTNFCDVRKGIRVGSSLRHHLVFDPIRDSTALKLMPVSTGGCKQRAKYTIFSRSIEGYLIINCAMF